MSKSDFLGSGNASQPEYITNMTSLQLMQFPGGTDIHDSTEMNAEDPQGRLFGTHIREAIDIVRDWVSERDRSR